MDLFSWDALRGDAAERPAPGISGQCGGSPGDASPCTELSGLNLYRSDHYDMWHNVAIASGTVNLFL
jgi:hypothetical protein